MEMSSIGTARLLAIALIAAASTAQAQSITFLTEHNPPFNFAEGGKPAGISTDVVNEMVKRAGVKAGFEVLPWNDAYRRAQIDKETCLYSTARLENREQLFSWIGPIATNRWVLVAKDDFAGSITKDADARKYKIGAVRADAKVEFLRAKAITNIFESDSEAQIPPKLFLKKDDPARVDLWVSSQYAYKATAEKAKVAGVKAVYTVGGQQLYIACSPRTSGDAFKRLRAADQSMRKDGTLDRLIAEGEKRLVK
jgi:polar amino acid transport system substrate-binding protein